MVAENLGLTEDVSYNSLMRELLFGENCQDVLRQSFMAKCHEHDREIAEAQASMGERVWMEDGRLEMIVHPFSYHYWGQRLGYECWDDDQFCKEYRRDNEACRVHDRSPKIQVGYGAASRYKLRKEQEGAVVA